jgi:holliday junction DNA helicase RuvA
MIAFLEGNIAEKTNDQVIISCAGVGYGVWVNTEDYGRLQKGAVAKVFVYEHIREQSHDLFGFLELPTKHLFELLLTVNGVGPKMALNILSVAKPGDVRQAIASGDVNLLKAANGVGKRVAERIIVDLKAKVGLETSGDWDGLSSGGVSHSDEAVDALIALGFGTLDAQRAAQGIDQSLPLEQRIKLALQNGAKR